MTNCSTAEMRKKELNVPHLALTEVAHIDRLHDVGETTAKHQQMLNQTSK